MKIFAIVKSYRIEFWNKILMSNRKHVVRSLKYTFFLSGTNSCLFSSRCKKENLVWSSDRLRFPPYIAKYSFGKSLSSKSTLPSIFLLAFPMLFSFFSLFFFSLFFSLFFFFFVCFLKDFEFSMSRGISPSNTSMKASWKTNEHGIVFCIWNI